jgi:hypothetical protein
MSTKTTFKRIALVAVASMGFGVLTSVAPANATTTGFSLSKSSITVVGANTGAAVFRIQLSQATANTAQSLQSDETLTVAIVGVPTGVTATKTVATNGVLGTDLVLTEGTVGTPGQPYSTWTANSSNATDGVFAPSQAAVADSSASGAVARSYYLRVSKGSNDPFDQGTYTLRFRLVKGSLLVSETTAKVTFVSSAIDSGAKLALSDVGAFYVGTAVTTYSATNNIKATLTDANDGQVINSDGTAPALTLDTVTSTGTTALTNGTLALVDDGSTADFGYAAATATASPANLAVNGTYGGTWSSPVLASETNRLRVRYGAASAVATVLVYPTTTATAGTASVTGTGITAGASAGTWSAPTSMTSARYTVALTKASGATAVQDEPVTITVTWGSTANAGDVTPVSGSDGAQVVKTDSTGRASITLTNASPINGQTATITATGTGATVTEQVITWRTSRAATALTSPNADFTAALKSTNTVTFTFLDSFGKPVVNDLISFTIAGANSALGTVVIPSARTNAQGQVSYTWTDAAAVTATATSTTGATDTITAASTTVTGTSVSRTVTYRTTVPVIATLDGKFDRLAATTYADVVPATTINTANGGTTAFDVNTTKDVTASLSSVTNDRVSFRYTAKDSAGLVVSGVPVTVSISAGGHIIGADGLPTASRIIYPTSDGLVDFSITATTPGTKTVTVTAGTVVKTAAVGYRLVKEDARVVSATATAEGLVTATVKDAFGNNVAGVELSATLTPGAEFGNRSTSMTVTTGTDGTVSFTVLGAGTLTLSASSSAYPKTTWIAGFADATGLAVQTGAPAGVRTVTLAVTGAGANDAAQAATDAAAEATDAANAATDAANAAAEAADAATAAAQDAADAVAALSTQVSEMVNALKKQITALTNLVIKIQKKVKA